MGELSSCSCFIVLSGVAWDLLNKICILLPGDPATITCHEKKCQSKRHSLLTRIMCWDLGALEKAPGGERMGEGRDVRGCEKSPFREIKLRQKVSIVSVREKGGWARQTEIYRVDREGRSVNLVKQDSGGTRQSRYARSEKNLSQPQIDHRSLPVGCVP